MNSSSSNPDGGSVCMANGFPPGFQFQSSQAHLKRFIMFDHSAGKGRVFLHPALAQELFGGSYQSKEKSCVKEDDAPNMVGAQPPKSECKFSAYREMISDALTSLQSVRSTRHSDCTTMQKQALTSMVSGFDTGKGHGLSEAPTTTRDPTVNVFGMLHSHASPNPLIYGEHAAAPTLPPDFTRLKPYNIEDTVITPTNSHTKATGEIETCESMRENTEDLDALLSCDYDDDDDDVRSTGHSPDESSGKEGNCCFDEDKEDVDDDNEVHQVSSKKRRLEDNEVEDSLKMFRSAEEGTTNRRSLQSYDVGQSSRKQKIKRTVRALRRMIPGGALLDAALVLDETILYVKMLRDHVNQLEAKRFHGWP